jgi:hypothetical protein
VGKGREGRRMRLREGRGGKGWVRGMWKSVREGQRGEYSKEVHGRGGTGGKCYRVLWRLARDFCRGGGLEAHGREILVRVMERVVEGSDGEGHLKSRIRRVGRGYWRG